MAKKYIVLDTETTGLEVIQGHRVIEIGAVLLNDRKKSEDHFHTFLNPSRSIDEEASKVHGIVNSDLEGMPSFDEIAEAFPETILKSVGYYGNANDAAKEVAKLSKGLDNLIVRIVSSQPGNKDSALDVMKACDPNKIKDCINA